MSTVLWKQDASGLKSHGVESDQFQLVSMTELLALPLQSAIAIRFR